MKMNLLAERIFSWIVSYEDTSPDGWFQTEIQDAIMDSFSM